MSEDTTSAYTSTAHLAAANMPDVWLGDHSLMSERLIVASFGGTGYEPPRHSQIMMAARLADKAAGEWRAAREGFTEYADIWNTHRSTGMWSAWGRGTGELENFVVTLDRLLRFCDGIVPGISRRTSASSVQITDVETPDGATMQNEELRSVLLALRNRIVHGYEDVAAGRGGQGYPTGTLEARQDRMVIQTREGGALIELRFADAAALLSATRHYLLDAIQG